MAKEKDIQMRHNERRKKRIKEQKRRRIIFFSTLALIVVLIVMFLTPLFNIKKVDIDIKTAETVEDSAGKIHISDEMVKSALGKVEGKNLFSYSKKGVKKKLSQIAFTDKVAVKKKVFPPTLKLEITECTPAFLAAYEEGYVLMDETGKVLEILKEIPEDENVPVAEGIAIASANVGEQVGFKDTESQKIIMSCIENMQKAGILGDITVMSFADLTNITFNYQERLDVICGTHIDFQRKLALFKEAINSTKLTKNSRGTINLSTTGKAIYTP